MKVQSIDPMTKMNTSNFSIEKKEKVSKKHFLTPKREYYPHMEMRMDILRIEIISNHPPVWSRESITRRTD